TLEAVDWRLQPFAVPFMALFERVRLPARSTLSRFLADLTKAPVEALRTLFLDDLLSRPLTNERQTGNLVDRTGGEWIVFDLDGTREAARQRALPQAEDLPPPFRRLDDVCAPGYTGRKRGQVVRTRTIISSCRRGCTCLPISPNSARKARSCAASTTVQKCRLAPRACRAAWW